MSKTFAPELRYIEDAHEALGLTYPQIAAALGTDEDTLHRWRAGIAEPGAAFIGRMEELHKFQVELLDALDPDAARAWLTRDVPALQGRRPTDLLMEGDIDPLIDIWMRINMGMPT